MGGLWLFYAVGLPFFVVGRLTLWKTADPLS